MGKENVCHSGAFIERGIIKSVEEDGYVIASYDRNGILLPPLTGYDGATYNVGDKVYYFVCCDGKGKIICGL
jgi:hypothetical protein